MDRDNTLRSGPSREGIPAVTWLRERGRALHSEISRGEPAGLARARALPELAGMPDPDLIREVRRRHALAVIAREHGFNGWSHLMALVRGDVLDDHGTLLVPDRGGAYWNIWSARYEQARAIREAHGGVLLGWRRHFLIVDGDYLAMLGIDPSNPDIDRMGRDWARPADGRARARLFGGVVMHRAGTERAWGAEPGASAG